MTQIKPILVFVHGWLANKNYWSKILPSFENIFEVCTLDLPGFGENPKPSETWDITNYANWLENFLKKKFGDKKINLIGHSFGGAVALKYTFQNQNLVEHLILYSPKLVPTKNFWTIFSKIFRLPAKLIPTKIRKKFAEKILNLAESDFYISQHLEEIYKKILQTDLRLEAKNLETKTLIIGGKLDSAVPEKNLKLFHKLIKNSQIKIFDDAGHFLHLENPILFSLTIKNFLLE
ncbi:MAG: alpha/beta fold hydrolase [Patescibacteria group bacterium]